MTTTHKSFHQIIATSLLTLFLLPFTVRAHSDDSAPAVSPEAALEKLLAGNERFMKGLSLEKHYIADRPTLANGQHPYAIILTCADSRLSPEAIFDESLGKLFVVRVAGNVSDPIILGSIEYAAEHLHASLLVVMGHEACGAVKAAVANSPVPPNIAKIVQRLRPAVEKARVYGRDENEIVAAAIKENVRYQVKMMTFESDVLSELVHERKLNIVGGIYNLNTGKVEFMRGREAAPEIKAQVSPLQPASKSPMAVPTSTAPVKALVAPTPQPKKPEAAKPAKNAPAKDASHSAHDDEEANLSSPPSNAAPAARKAVTFHSLAFADKLRAAFENKYEVALKTATLLRDSHDRCLSADCRSLPAGEIVTLESPHILSVLGRPSVRVRHGKQRFYVPAEEKNFAFSEVPAEPAKTLVGQMLTAPTRFKNAFSPTTKQ
jgi:carbonic anhydrase